MADHDVLSFDEKLETVLEVASFCLVEAISLAFFPYQTEERYENMDAGTGGNMENSVAGVN